MTTARDRWRRAGSPQPPPPPPRPTGPRAAHTIDFNIPLRGDGVVSLLDYTPTASEYARVDFRCLVPGTLHIRIDGTTALRAKTGAGRALVTGLFFPEGSRVAIEFTNSWGGGAVSGTISIAPAPVTDALVAARTLFGLAQHYTADELSRAHKRLVVRWHPDRPGGNTAKMAEINHYMDLLKAHIKT